MRKYSFFVVFLFIGLILQAQSGKLKVGDKATDWKFKDADGVIHSMDTWKGKVLQINYVDPDESDLNDPFNDEIDKAVDESLDASKLGKDIVSAKNEDVAKSNLEKLKDHLNKVKKIEEDINKNYIAKIDDSLKSVQFL